MTLTLKFNISRTEFQTQNETPCLKSKCKFGVKTILTLKGKILRSMSKPVLNRYFKVTPTRLLSKLALLVNLQTVDHNCRDGSI